MQPTAAVLVLLWGEPPHVLLERKNCSVNNRFSCDIAFPGGRIKAGETPVEAALREAWEEAWIPPGMVRVIRSLGVFSTLSEPKIYTEAVLALPSGPIEARPRDPEVDAVFWVDITGLPSPGEVYHAKRGRTVSGVRLGEGLILWGLTLRIVQRVISMLKTKDT